MIAPVGAWHRRCRTVESLQDQLDTKQTDAWHSAVEVPCDGKEANRLSGPDVFKRLARPAGVSMSPDLEAHKKDGRLALALIREIDPAPQASVSIGIPTTVEDVSQLGLAELRALLADNPAPAELESSSDPSRPH